MKIVIAPDSYKGSLTSLEVGTTMKEAFLKEVPGATIDVVPMADGGEGTLDTLLFATNGKRFHVEVTGPLGEPVETAYGVLGTSNTVVIETANIAGLPMVPSEIRNPMNTTSYGVGEAIIEAVKSGHRDFIIGLGGSATNDGGLGMLQALGVKFVDENEGEVSPFASSLSSIKKVDFSALNPIVKDCKFRIASDVNNPLCGEQGATAVFGPQKGATSKQVKELDFTLKQYAQLIEETLGIEHQSTPGAGAAGGLGFAFLLIGAEIISGSEIIAEATNVVEKIRHANWVITGEGQSDYQTLYGKVPAFIAKAGKRYNVPTILISGGLGDGYEKLYDYFVSCHSITAGPISLEACIKNAEILLFNQTRNIARLIKATK
ncbi:glycerate kinase [Lottiidibacillus patelloidae]|uniref:Glycerate kinase n=1 Tax=Lottiidibacillus patelloidae TaxID=2670334 RepID=A0A263BSF6_9BACI|nr:glycerate kinase [Lottiidibacillus patelloidae]OZM56644.1 glycerate kinase [Lottiidibacillus patelloidae]